MFSPTDRARLAVLAFSLAGCGANGDQVLGTIVREDTPISLDASPAPDSGGGCSVFGHSDAREIGFDLSVYFLVDRSQTMTDPMGDKWDAFVSGFTLFLRSPTVDGIGIGAGYFPTAGNGDCGQCRPGDCTCLASCGCPCDMRMDPRPCPRTPWCDPNSYDRADVDIAPMPQNGSALLVSLTQLPFGPNVMRPALQGALEFATEHAARNRNERVEVVLVAGGPPYQGECMPNNISDCADAAGSSNTKTHVVAFDYTGSSLDSIAGRGGGRLYTVDHHRDNVSARFADIVSNLRNQPHCQYDLPSDTTDWNRVNLQINFPNDAGTGETTRIVRQVKNRQACNGDQGWYYDDAAHPSRIIACDATCNTIHGPPEGKVETTVGCGAPPPQ
jgi:hypothetical protein